MNDIYLIFGDNFKKKTQNKRIIKKGKKLLVREALM